MGDKHDEQACFARKLRENLKDDERTLASQRLGLRWPLGDERTAQTDIRCRPRASKVVQTGQIRSDGIGQLEFAQRIERTYRYEYWGSSSFVRGLGWATPAMADFAIAQAARVI